MKTRHPMTGLLLFAFAAVLPASGGDLTPGQVDELLAIRCNNLTYAAGKTSVCFADKFLATTARETGLDVLPRFHSVRLDTEALFDSPFTVISGEGSFRFSKGERENLLRYLKCGGFLLASPGCSDQAWDQSFRAELRALFPDAPLEKIPMAHSIFSTVYQVSSLSLKSGGTTLVEGIEIDGRLALIYSSEGLNDVANAKGCCCCGGNQIRESEKVNVNILIHALLN
ncbi:MAG: DUF4159 domain-containing protein [Verrucomicrobiales bacterium]